MVLLVLLILLLLMLLLMLLLLLLLMLKNCGMERACLHALHDATAPPLQTAEFNETQKRWRRLQH
jgi:hypothetical protein